jgi:hypothetical protein
MRNAYHLEDSRRWKDDIKMDLRETGCEDERGMKAAQYRVQWRAM